MSSYEDYASTSAHYDTTRRVVGAEILLGCLATGATPLPELVLLDAGCGTGSYAEAVLGQVGRIEAIDASPGMLDVASRKLAAHPAADRITFAQGSVDELPFDDSEFDAVMVNQVLHHLGGGPEEGWQRLERVISEIARVLRPGGTLVVNTCSPVQLTDGYWYYSLIPRAVERVQRRFAPLAVIEGFMAGRGLRPLGRFVPVDGVIQGESYFDARGPLRSEWRSGDSTWALVEDDELAGVQAELADLERRGTLAEDMARRDLRRPDIGQITFVAARSDPS